MAPTAPVARTTNTTTKAPAPKSAGAARSIPFTIASLRRCRQAFSTGNLVLGQSVPSTEIPAAGGFLRWIDLSVVGTTSGNSANVTFNADGPFSALQFVEFQPPSGDPPIVPLTGYQLYLWNKYGNFGTISPNGDPRRDPNYGATTGTTATGGSFSFNLRLPFEIDPGSGFCSITNSASNKSYMLNFTVGTSAQIYGTVPTTAPTVVVTGWMYYWDEPQASTSQGTNQATGPLGLGSFSQLRVDQPPLTAGAKYIKVNNAGPVLRDMILVLRNSSSARENTDIPAMWDFVFNTRDRFLVSDTKLQTDMAFASGFGLVATNTAGGNPEWDLPNGLDTGVRWFPYFRDFGNGLNPMGPRSQYQVTADATLTQILGTSWGSGAATLEIHTNLIRPSSAGALYPSSRIS